MRASAVFPVSLLPNSRFSNTRSLHLFPSSPPPVTLPASDWQAARSNQRSGGPASLRGVSQWRRVGGGAYANVLAGETQRFIHSSFSSFSLHSERGELPRRLSCTRRSPTEPEKKKNKHFAVGIAPGEHRKGKGFWFSEELSSLPPFFFPRLQGEYTVSALFKTRKKCLSECVRCSLNIQLERRMKWMVIFFSALHWSSHLYSISVSVH